MSGIVGLWYFSSRCNADGVVKGLWDLQSALKHRGPDGGGVWTEGPVGLGHQLLKTTPESCHEQSPQGLPEAHSVITADVRLDNRLDLIRQLGLPDCPSSSRPWTDPDLILKAYERWDTACPQHLLGAYAFLIWDARRQRMFGARDPFGIKPFYYFYSHDLFAVASEIKALLRSPHIPAQLNPLRIADLLTSNLQDPVATSYRDILRLPGAHQLLVSADQGLTIQRYWRLDPSKTLQLPNDQAYADAFQEIFKQAVDCRLRSAYPIGTQLSGGMDSSAVSCMARQRLPSRQPLPTFSARFPRIPNCDEMAYIQAVLDQGGYVPHFVYADRTGPLSHWQELWTHLDEPALGNGYLTWLIHQAAQQQGIRVLLSGYDGDTTVGHGTGYPAELARSGRWKLAIAEMQMLIQRLGHPRPVEMMRQKFFPILATLAQEGRWLSLAKAIAPLSRAVQLPRRRLWIDGFLIPLSQHLRGQIRRRTRPLPRPDRGQAFPFLNPDFLHHPDIVHHFESQPLIADGHETAQSQQLQLLCSGIISLPMELVDLISAPLGIEPRYPFMDQRLVEFCLALPPDQKLRQGWSRYILRQAMDGILPDQVQWRASKTSPAQAFYRGFDQYNAPLVEDLLAHPPPPLLDYINLPQLRQLYADHYRSPDRLNQIWPAITLGLWFRHQESSPYTP